MALGENVKTIRPAIRCLVLFNLCCWVHTYPHLWWPCCTGRGRYLHGPCDHRGRLVVFIIFPAATNYCLLSTDNFLLVFYSFHFHGCCTTFLGCLGRCQDVPDVMTAISGPSPRSSYWRSLAPRWPLTAATLLLPASLQSSSLPLA